MSDDVVRLNEDTHRVVTACECGRTVSLPDSGLSRYDCPCGRVWTCNGEAISMWDRRREP